MDNYLSSSAINPPTSFTTEKMQEIIDLICPVLYYSTAEFIERGYSYYIKESDLNPEFIVCHPDDLDILKHSVTWRRFVHIVDEPSKDILQRFIKKYGVPKFDYGSL